MKALVLAGGTGTRLRPLSHSMPKQLIPVANKPVLFYALDSLRAAGITDVGIIVGAQDTAIRAAVGTGERFGIETTYIPQEQPKGLAHCVMIARDFLADDDFVMYLGDNIFADGIAEPIGEFARNRPTAQLAVSKVSQPSQYGIVEIDASGRVVALQEKPAHPTSDLAITGVYVFTPQIHEAVRGIEPSWRNEWEITDAVQWLVRRGGEVRAKTLSGFWKDTGTPAELLECNKVLLEDVTHDVRGSVDPLSEITGPVVVEEGARLERSVVVGPAVIGAGCTIEDSYVGPYTSLGNGCRLREAGIEYSILLDRASVSGVGSIQGSVIGQAGVIERSGDETVTHRYLVGDDSRIEVSV